MSQVKIDVIILSYAKNEELKTLTLQTIQTLLASEKPDDIAFNVLVIESNKDLKPFQFENTTTIYPDAEFGYNKFMNTGIKATQNGYLCLCNNDLIFRKGWASEILKVMQKHPKLMSANPRCDDFNYSVPINRNRETVMGNASNMFKGVLTGWCIFIRRELINKIGFLDEQFSFWYADRDYGATLLSNKIKHALVINSVVTHLGNKSHNAVSADKLQQFTYDQKGIYEQKWGKEKVGFKQQLKKVLKRLSGR